MQEAMGFVDDICSFKKSSHVKMSLSEMGNPEGKPLGSHFCCHMRHTFQMPSGYSCSEKEVEDTRKNFLCSSITPIPTARSERARRTVP